MWVEDEHPAPAFAPGYDVLSDEIFEKFAFAGAGASADIEVLVAERARKSQRRISRRDLAENEVVARCVFHYFRAMVWILLIR